MSEINTGGPAFPLVAQNWHHKGMDLRDYFAAKAMQSFIVEGGMVNAGYDFNFIAKASYEMADLMLKERTK